MKYIHFILLLIASCLSAAVLPASSYIKLEGRVIDSISNKPLEGVYIYLPDFKKGGLTDNKGTYSITNLSSIKTTIMVSLIGHQTIIRDVDLKVIHHLDFTLKETNAMLGEVVVKGLSGNSMLKTVPAPVSYISHRELQERSSTNIIDAIAHEPGVSQITTGGGISKPVIRGLGYNRIVVVNNGVRQEGQQWGDEHGIEIDDQSVYSARILKGPASLMYGSDAMAGVIIFEEEPTPPEGKTSIETSSEYQTNNGLFAYSLRGAGNTGSSVWNLRYSDKMAHAYKNAYDGYVFNSGFREQALSGMYGLNKNWGYSHLSFSYYHLTPDIIEGERDSISGKFMKSISDNGKEVTVPAEYSDFKSYRHAIPYQQVYHLKAVLDNSILLGEGSLKLLLGYQQNRRQEYEDALAPTDYGLYFLLHTINYDIHYLSPEWNGWKIASGVNGMFQQSLNKGTEYLTPAYRLFDFGYFLTANRSINKWDLSGGIRFDNRSIDGHELLEDNTQRFPSFSKHFNGLTGSLGGIFHLSQNMNLRLNVSRGYRAPNISELASNGIHEGTVRYELGNLKLKPESNMQLDLGFDYSSPYFSTQVSLFLNRIDNYIFAHKLTSLTNQPILTDGEPTYQFSSGNAVLHGGEFLVDYHPIEKIHWENTFSFVNSILLHEPRESKYLPFTPAPRWTTTMKYDLIRDGKLINNAFVGLNFEYDFKQNHFYAEGNTESFTPDYGLINLNAGADFMILKQRTSLFIEVTNLTNKSYQNHLSRLKYTDMNNATGRQGIYNMGRNICFKVIIPLLL
jgi:iron complex outermembrane receptor protein